ncbi:MAG: hypothetical protein NXI10_03475 [bacterium]|nr:hypothetical protein [bacterium]
MDQGIENIAIVYGGNEQKFIDDAVYRNFLVRRKEITPFYAVAYHSGMNLMVSDDILEITENVVIHPLTTSYAEMDYDHIDTIAQDTNPLDHWAEIRGAFSTMDGEVLRFILAMDIPLNKFIRQELAARGYDENHNWVGFEKAKKIWRV